MFKKSSILELKKIFTLDNFLQKVSSLKSTDEKESVNSVQLFKLKPAEDILSLYQIDANSTIKK